MQSIYLAGVVREGEILGDVDECMLTHGLQVKKTAHLKVIALFFTTFAVFLWLLLMRWLALLYGVLVDEG